MRGQLESRFRLFWYCNMPFAVFASAKPHGTRAFARLFVHAGVRFPRPFAGAIGTLFENAKLIFPPGAVETASAAIFIISGTTGLIAVKSRLLLHEQFKRPLLALCEIHSGCTSSYYKVVVIRVPLQGQNATIDKVLWIGLNLLPQDGFGKAPTTALCF